MFNRKIRFFFPVSLVLSGIINLVACGNPPSDNDSDGGADETPREQIACNDDADCSPGTCNQESGLCVGPRGEPGRDGANGVGCVPMQFEGQECLVIICGEFTSNPLCPGDDGRDGERGAPGQPGADGGPGEPGRDGTGCSITRSLDCVTITCANTSETLCLPDEGGQGGAGGEAGMGGAGGDAGAGGEAGRGGDPVDPPPADRDNDGIPDNTDNCPDERNPGQENLDGDRFGDDCDDDQDGDGFTTDANDCDDRDDEVHPGAQELCDDLDSNCNGDVTEACEVDLIDGGVNFEFSLPEGLSTSMIAMQGCWGQWLEGGEFDGDHLRLVCSQAWEELDRVNSNTGEAEMLSTTVPVPHGQGIEYNFNFEHLDPFWSCTDLGEVFGSVRAWDRDGDLDIVWVDNRQDGCNFWTVRP